MICPRCHAEFREEMTRCSDCDVDLVPPVPKGYEEEADDRGATVEVLRTANPAAVALAQSLLDDAGIPHEVRGLESASLLPFGRVVDTRFFVRTQDSADARSLLDDLTDERWQEASGETAEYEGEDDADRASNGRPPPIE